MTNTREQPHRLDVAGRLWAWWVRSVNRHWESEPMADQDTEPRA
jgi:hypothetical protein